MTTSLSDATPDRADVDALLAPWTGPFGGLPPFDHANPPAIEAACLAAIDSHRQALRQIADAAEPPTFENTLLALEDQFQKLQRVRCVASVWAQTMSIGTMPAVAQRLAPLWADLQDRSNQDPALYARVDTLWQTRDRLGLNPQQQRLLQVVRERMQRAGAGLPAPQRERLAELNRRVASLCAQYDQNLRHDQSELVVWVDDPCELDGLPDSQRQAAAALADARGAASRFAIANTRGAVWPVLMHARHRGLRQRVWEMWNERGNHAGPHDNRPVANQILALRGEIAEVLGFPSHAHLKTSERMAGTPDVALAMLHSTWDSVIDTTRQQIAAFQAIADDEALSERRARFALAPWDRQFHAEKLRRSRFGLDAGAVRPYLALDNVLQAMFWSAGQLHGLHFTELHGVPVPHPTVRVFALQRHADTRSEAQPAGLLYFDLLDRPGKSHGSYQFEYRSAAHDREKVLPIASISSSFAAAADGGPVLLPWEVANVFFHEFGHALHMLLNESVYPTLGSLGVAWDFIELPALLHERWLLDRTLLRRFALHVDTGEPMPEALLDSIEAAARFDRIFALNLDYLAPAIVDLRMHLLADGRPLEAIDVAQIESDVLAELGMPAAWDQIMRVTSSFHSFVGAYAAGVYSYLWADVMAADAADAFLQAPGGLYDRDVARAWREQIMAVGNQVPAEQAWLAFRGRAPDPLALLRRFGLPEPAAG